MPQYSIETFGQLEPFVRREWLLTNGIGGFSFGTVVGCNTRRYHGLLIAATNPPVGRMSILSRLGEILIVDGQTYELAVNQFFGNVHPNGYTYLQRFDLGTTAKWTYQVEGIAVTKEALVPWKKNIVGIRYTIDAVREIDFRVAPFFALRDFHALRRAAGYDMPATVTGRSISVSSDNITGYVSADAGEWVAEPQWWHGHVYPIETDRGQDDNEDLFTPGKWVIRARGKTTVTFWASNESIAALDWDREVAQRADSTYMAPGMPGTRSPARENSGATSSSTAPRESSVVPKLLRAANDFIVARKTPEGKPGTSILAGYPWFADWGRDTFISLPGLLLIPGRFDRAKEVLTVFAAYVADGMIPNRFDDYTSEPSYNTVDASLWFIHAAFEYARLSKDSKTFEEILKPACRKIIDGYRKGTRFKIRMDEADSLIQQGDENTQLTWMDAKCNGVAFTPRQGKPVEINALWYHALVLMGEKQLAEKVRESFSKAFWISPFRGLADVVSGSGPYDRDSSIRPNQIFAASLPNSPLSAEQQSAVVEVVRRELLTPLGLRTLAKTDPRYRPHYTGSQFIRDQAYHNGMVWPWLIGGFFDAYLRVHSESPDAIAQVKRWLSPLIDALETNCLGQLAEIYEPEEPQRAVGCCAQAWSIAEVLRIAVRVGM